MPTAPSCCSSAANPPLPLPWDLYNEEDNDGIYNGDTVFSVSGTGPLVLTAPHGGNLRPPEIPDRTAGCLEPDIHSAQLAWSVFAHCQTLRPSLIIGKLHRSKVDFNRPRPDDSAHTAAIAAWDDYHSAIQQSLDAALAQHGYAHLVDLHGQCHRPTATEIGHLLTNSDLRQFPLSSICLATSSLAAMANLPTFQNLEDLVRGPFSMGSLLESEGYAAVPSPRQPHPCCCTDGIDLSCDFKACGRTCTGLDVVPWKNGPEGCGPCSFFWGSNTLCIYGGGRRKRNGEWAQLERYRGVVAATQLETSWNGCRENDDQIQRFGAALGRSIGGFLTHFYDPKS
jgi:hypothetical protein